MGVAAGRLDLDHTVADFEDRHVKGAAAEVEDEDRLAVFLIQSVSQRRCRRFVDDPQHVQSGDLTGIFGRLALRVVEVRRDGDHRLRDRLTEVRFRVFLEFAEDHRADFLRRVALAGRRNLDPGVAGRARVDLVGQTLGFVGDFRRRLAHQPLDRKDGVFRIDDCLSFCRLTDDPFVVLGEGDHRRRGAAALGVGDHDRLAVFKHGDARIGCP